MHDDLKKIKNKMKENKLIIDLSDKSLFGNDAGEDESPEILESYFLNVNNSEGFFDKNCKLSIVSARKGMGKSSLLSLLNYELEKNDKKAIVIRTTGNELLGLGDFSGKDQIYLENYWKQIICKKVNLEIGRRIGFALTNDQIMMVENAELENMKQKNFIGALLDRLKFKLTSGNIETEISNGTLPENWKNLLENYQKENENSYVWLLIDDIDAKYNNNIEYQERVSSFFSAIRSLAHGIERLNIRATVRSDVWNSILHIEDLDKLEQYIFEIKWSKNQMRDILAKKISAFIKRNHITAPESKLDYNKQYKALFNIVFNEEMNWSGKKISFYEPILIYSNKRPRWMGQLCRYAAENAYHNGFNQISERNLISVLEKFGKNRVADFRKEHKHQFEYIQELVDTFRSGNRNYNREQLNKKINDTFLKKFKSKIEYIDGEPYIEEDQLGKFLYKIGFLATKENGSYKSFEDKPDLFESHKNFENKILWEIHPAYRNYLNIK